MTSYAAALRNPRYARLYAAQAISQFGDAFTWVGLALTAAALVGPDDAAGVLATALTLRVLVFVVVSPIAGVVADRVERRLVLVACDAGRALVLVALAFVTVPWHVYLLIAVLSALTATFTPTNQATIPLLVGPGQLPSAFALSAGTSELVGIIGPGIAGVLAAMVGWQALFEIDAATFVVSAVLVATLGSLRTPSDPSSKATQRAAWRDLVHGSARLWADRQIRTGVLMELVAAVAGACVLTMTIATVAGRLGAGTTEYGVVMAVYGLGAAIGSLSFGWAGGRWPSRVVIVVGGLLATTAILPGDALPLVGLAMAWAVAGIGQAFVNVPVETMLAERTEPSAQGRVYGAHFAWSHLWWVGAYPLAGLIHAWAPHAAFLVGGLLGCGVWLAVMLSRRRPAPGR